MVNLDVNFSVNYADRLYSYSIQSDKDIIVLTGTSGSGKSTFLNALVGRMKVKGDIKSNARVWSDSKDFHMPIQDRNVAWVPQNHLLFPHINVQANLEFYGHSKSEDLNEVISALELEKLLLRTPNKLSGGEGQRVAIGRALLSTLRFPESGLLLLDEPFASLDEALARQVSHFIIAWCKERSIQLVYSVHQIDRIVGIESIDEDRIAAFLLNESDTKTDLRSISWSK